jgi:hypothetical protein
MVNKILLNIRPKIISHRYLDLKREIELTCPILMHIRLKDYLSEKAFGIPATRYFEKCLEEVCLKKDFSKIWVISDDTPLAKEYLAEISTQLPVYFLSQNELSDTQVWDLMRYFSAYIISNSTFAWWAAFLRKDQSAPVYAPDPWFQGMESPNMLIPEDWIRIEAK